MMRERDSASSSRRGRIRLRAHWFVAVLSALVVSGTAFAAQPAGATSDTFAPVLYALSFIPSTVDISAGPAVVNVQMRVVDDVSGVASGCISFDTPSPASPYNGGCFDA